MLTGPSGHALTNASTGFPLTVIIERLDEQFLRLGLDNLALERIHDMRQGVVTQLSHLVFRAQRRVKVLLLQREVDQFAPRLAEVRYAQTPE